MADTDHTLPIIAISPSGVTNREGNSGITPYLFTVTRSGDASQASTIDWAVASFGSVPGSLIYQLDDGQLNAEDFGGTLPSGTMNFAPGESTKTLTVPIQGDQRVERDEHFKVMLSNPIGATLDTNAFSSIGSILNDDIPFSISMMPLGLASTGIAEGNTGSINFDFYVGRDVALNPKAFSVNWRVVGYGQNPADAADFGGTLPSGTIHFAEGEHNRVISIRVTGDRLPESDEGFRVELSTPVAASGGSATDVAMSVVIETRSALGTIKDDDNGDSSNLLSIMSGGTGRHFRMDPYSGPVTWLKNMHIAEDDGEAMVGSAVADFINARGGDDAVDGGMGDDVLDGGTGSNWLVGGFGNDTFFIDGRGGGTTWSTVTDLEKGEWVTAWGWTEGVSKLTWAEMAGAEGNKGATAHIDLDANGSIDMSLTIAGKSSGAILVMPGQVNGSSYLAFTLA
ncbi:hypothetical protein Sp245p_02685 [Azospirillum baldaniorum]|uniref:Calx-beta domain-containing protein n=1 Tax=Azospirillum baldaniorum TaxID=1064539 RepID=A0A9P1NKD5_9PROT|nr:Calx-beta domain-containing protein [Azospirillum baldaniorum]AWJ88766.1 hypothetical protein Sp245p_02685 [Azospirillum baldaniorum]TWA79693.1 Calx-beta domain-containing protein [Azospirillum brasilense]CCC96246.1 protein of unknown function [Azospirillum baldaniorum]